MNTQLNELRAALAPEALERLLAAQFPPTATSWSQATDEVRDLCRAARELAKVPEGQALDFRLFDTPSQWNTLGVAGIVRFYTMLSPQDRATFCASSTLGQIQ